MMMTQSIPLDNCEVTRVNKFPNLQSDAHAEAAESLSSLEKENSTIVTNGNSESAMAPQKVRTERYVKVSVRGLNFVKSKSLFLSWFLDNNGLPDCCTLLIPERHPNVILSFKGTHGWIELDTNHCKAPDYEVQFELKLHHAFLNRRRYVQNQPIVLRFFLLDKKENGTIESYGEVLLSVLLMSSKCANRTLIAHYVPDEKHAPPPPPPAPTPVVKASPQQPPSMMQTHQMSHERKTLSSYDDDDTAIGQPLNPQQTLAAMHHQSSQYHQMHQSNMGHNMSPQVMHHQMSQQAMNHHMNPHGLSAPHMNPQVMSHQILTPQQMYGYHNQN